MGYDINVAVHEAGHAVVLASLGYASEIEYITVAGDQERVSSTRDASPS